jgi:hypothetical protein
MATNGVNGTLRAAKSTLNGTNGVDATRERKQIINDEKEFTCVSAAAHGARPS